MEQFENQNRSIRGEARSSALLFVAIGGVAAVVAFAMIRSASKPANGGAGLSPAATQGGAPSASTQPGIEVVAPGVARAGGTNAAALNPDGGENTVAHWVAVLNDPSLSLAERKKAIQALAQNGSPEAVAALKAALGSSNQELRAAVAEGLGACVSPQCTAMMIDLLNDANPSVVGAALRGLGQQGSPEAATALTSYLYDTQKPLDLRCDAALALGNVNQPGVLQTLTQAALSIQDPDLVKQVLAALGTRDIAETKDFFQGYLRSPTTPPEMKVEAVEALAGSRGDPGPFLSTLVTDSDSEIRAAAAWAMSATDEPGNFGAELMAALQGESDPDVRLRLYQALRNQSGFDFNLVLGIVQKEADLGARIAGLNLVASMIQGGATPEVQAYFDQTGAPELARIAVNGEKPNERMSAFIALVRANTPSAVTAIQGLSQQAGDPRIQDSAKRYLATLTKAGGQ